jgi:TPR repeat protein
MMNKKSIVLILAIYCNPFVACSQTETANDLNKKSQEYLLKKDFKNALPLVKKAAMMGNPEAQYNYGIFYQQGIEIQQDDQLANQWFLKSAEQDWKDAQFKIAYRYDTGRGFPQDYQKAFYWSLKCAEQNDPGCMFYIVGAYQEGRGVDKNLNKMFAWATKLALLENPEDLALSGKITSARANLAYMYRDGKNVLQDKIKSYVWFLIYNESKKDFSTSDQHRNIEAIKKLEEGLTEADKAKAKTEAEQLLGRKLKNLNNLHQEEF